MDPVEALERTVYLLDRSLAPAPKVKAFARAADVVRDLDPGELREMHKGGRLKELPGIGDSTSAVIAEALEGKVPDYLAKLEDSTVI
ncbi:MAG: putative hydrolase, partial [Acidimicrobiaceae bacterium]